MPIFRYKGLEANGSKASGTLEADVLSEALRTLKERGIFIQDIHEELSKKRLFLSFRKDSSEFSYITRQLSILLSTGVSLVDSIKSIAEQQKGFWRSTLISIKEKLSAGSSLSRVMEDYPDVFPEYYISMVHAGETGGGLDRILIRLADFLESQEEIKSQIRSASIYPVFILLVSSVVLFFIFTFVVPKITKIFEDTEAALPFITIILIKISHIFQYYWWLILIFVFIMVYGVKFLIKRKEVFYSSLLYKVSILNTLYISRFLRIMGFLLSGSVPVLKSLQLSAKSVGNKFIQNHLLEVERKIAEGASLSSTLLLFPPVVKQIIATGEKSGGLSDVILQAADTYEKEFSIKIKRYLSILEPVMILIMGIIIGIIVFAVLLPIFELNQLIQ